MVSALQLARDAARQRVSVTPRGTNFVRRVIAEALAKAETGNAIDIARSRWGATSAVAQNIEKANKPAGVTSGGWGADFIPTPPDTAEFFGAVDARSIPGQLPGIRNVPFHTGSLGIVVGTGVDWVREGFAVPIGSPVTYKVSGLVSYKLAVATVITEEMLRDSDPRVEDAIRTDLLNSAAYALNAAFIDPANVGGANVKPASVTSGQGSSNSPASTFADTGDIIDPTNTTQVSLFQTNSIGVMVTRRANWAMAKSNCVSYVNISVG